MPDPNIQQTGGTAISGVIPVTGSSSLGSGQGSWQSWIGPASQVTAAGFNAASTAMTNRKQRRWQEFMMDKQRQWALDDWNMQNAYNSPSAQMARLKAAGLNPNLVYGHGDVGNAGGQVRSSPSANYSPQAPQIPVMNPLSSMYDMQYRQATIDNVEAQTQVAKMQALFVAANTKDKLAGAGNKEFDLDMKNQLKEITLGVKKIGLQKAEADLMYTLDENERKWLTNTSDLKTAVQQRLNYQKDRLLKDQQISESKSRQGQISENIEYSVYRRGQIVQQLEYLRKQINNAERDGALKDIEIQWRKSGWSTNTPYFWKWLDTQLNNY